MSCQRQREEQEDMDQAESNMKLPKIKRATWEKEYHPGAKWVVVERKYNTYSAHNSLFKAIRKWFCHLGFRRKKK